MDYKDLANLIFPNAKPISYYEEKYPERNLPEGAMVVRFAPSPTGYVHIGGLYQSIICTTLAKQTKGVSILRIEDTDQKRLIENGVVQIVEAVKDFGIVFDEGMINETEEKGNYGPYKQSARKDIYQAFAKYLIEQGRAYPCFATPEELDEMRKKQEAAKIRPGYYGVWATYRNLSVEEAAKKIKAGEPYIVRFKSMGNEERKIRHHDVIKGNVEFPENDQDIVIIKADGLPTYHFAHAVDDHLMRVTHVIRADEWLSSVPLHLELFKALGFAVPKYAHTSAILKDDEGKKRKISKRKDPEAAVSYYHEEGIPAEAVYQYLLNIANSNFETWKRSNPDKDISEFEVYNDINGELVNLFRCVKYHPEALEKEFEFILNSREVFNRFKTCNFEHMTDIQRAARYLYLIRASYSAKMGSFGVKSRDILNMEVLKNVHKRLSKTVIENKSFPDIIKYFNKEDVLLYLDPPYHNTEYFYDTGKFDFNASHTDIDKFSIVEVFINPI